MKNIETIQWRIPWTKIIHMQHKTCFRKLIGYRFNILRINSRWFGNLNWNHLGFNVIFPAYSGVFLYHIIHKQWTARNINRNRNNLTAPIKPGSLLSAYLFKNIGIQLTDKTIFFEYFQEFTRRNHLSIHKPAYKGFSSGNLLTAGIIFWLIPDYKLAIFQRLPEFSLISSGLKLFLWNRSGISCQITGIIMLYTV